MKTIPPRLPAASAALLAGAWLLAGCLQERLAWSPDGRRATIITADGLHLSGATGQLSALLLAGAYRAAWLPDSERLVVARRKPARTFAEVAAALGPERTRALVAKARSIGSRLADLPPTPEANKLLSAEIGEDLPGVLAYLREQPEHLAALRSRFAGDWKQEDETRPVDLHEILLARVVGPGLELGATLFTGLPAIHTLRPSPTGRAVAFTLAAELGSAADTSIAVHVAPLDTAASAVLVSTHTTTHPDWTPDGRALVFFQAAGMAGGSEELHLGTLLRRGVIDSHGRVALVDEPVELATLGVRPRSRVRCLRDGRVLFNASALHLPSAGSVRDERDQLFTFTDGATPTLRPVMTADELPNLPGSLATFEVSPDGAQALVAAEDAAVWLVDLAAGRAEFVSDKIERVKEREDGENYPAPAWRAPGEFAYLRRKSPADPLELVLRRADGEQVLSRSWDHRFLRRLVE